MERREAGGGVLCVGEGAGVAERRNKAQLGKEENHIRTKGNFKDFNWKKRGRGRVNPLVS